MNHRLFVNIRSVLFLLVIATAPVWGENNKPVNVDEKANRLMLAMNDLLASAKTITFKSTEVHDRMRGGKKEQLQVSREAAIQRPDRLWFQMSGKTGDQPFDASVWYDGLTLTMQSDYKKVFARTKMPPTLDEAIDYAAANLDMPMPMADVFYSSPYEAFMTANTKGGFVKAESINGKECDLLAFEQKAVDWRIWIAQGDRPFLCQLEITYKLNDGQPRSVMTFSDWKLDGPIAEDQFKHQPPDDYEKIAIIGRLPMDEKEQPQTQPDTNR